MRGRAAPKGSKGRGVARVRGLADRMAVVGLGLIGGSLALAARQQRLVGEVVGIDRDPAHLRAARARRLTDGGTEDLSEGVRDADLVVLAVPVASVVPAAREAAPHLRPGAVLTDVGSVKGPIVRGIEALAPRAWAFVGGHPVAGTERSGPGAARPDLFRGARCVLTPTARTDPGALERVMALWKGVGATVTTMEPEQHDAVLAAVSHLPHMVAYALVGALLALREDGGPLLEFSAGGLRDFTRIAMSHPVMWRDICLMNRGPLLAVLERYRGALGELERLIAAGDGDGLQATFARARAARREGL